MDVLSNRQSGSGPWGGGVEMLSKLEEAMAQVRWQFQSLNND